MTYRREIIPHCDLYEGRRVYVKDLDVFGRIRKNPKDSQLNQVVCEDPMPDYIYNVTGWSVLFDDAIGDRESENDL